MRDGICAPSQINRKGELAAFCAKRTKGRRRERTDQTSQKLHRLQSHQRPHYTRHPTHHPLLLTRSPPSLALTHPRPNTPIARSVFTPVVNSYLTVET